MKQEHTHYIGMKPITHSHKAPNQGWFEKGRLTTSPDHHHKLETLDRATTKKQKEIA